MSEAHIDLCAFGYAPGNYMQCCADCNRRHVADKRARRCKDCAQMAHDEQPVTTDSPPSMRDVCQEHIADVFAGHGVIISRAEAGRLFSVIMSELESPSEGAISYGEGYMDMTMPDGFPDRGKPARDREFRTGFVASIQHIKDGGQ